MTPREKVIDYMKDEDTSCLTIIDKNGKEIKLKDNDTVNKFQIVTTILQLLRHYDSAEINNDGLHKIKVGNYRLRSSFDIWRHAIYYDKNITIFDVMNILSGLKKNVTTLYCTTINRRVFRYNDGETYITDTTCIDEYGLILIDWCDI